MRSFATVVAVEDHVARVVEQGREQTLSALDTVILAGWHIPVAERYFELKAAGIPVTRVGDAIASRTMMEAVHEGERAARDV
jgi:predicted HAD superfamily phosphohydrolase